ncbi:hypothetical protein PHJA_001801000 [Phtheirospermum japonicum]|uniref:VQ domain-containing protein n=1 Tax=Phtheirospermum japonicum TaxID=374723 RepID=A0A830CBJ7_9LAMI|nr:hypothetical protein PHJA_001801000 [Phtheirospermum japonicum]
MPISETMSNSSEWMQLYQTNITHINQIEVPPPSTATATTTTTASRNNNITLDQGRIRKPNRRRSRVSQRAPATLVNTDATNFRAMVQQFTGGPSARSQLPGTFDTQQDANTTTSQYTNQMQQHDMFTMYDDYMYGGGGGGKAGGGGRVSSDICHILDRTHDHI